MAASYGGALGLQGSCGTPRAASAQASSTYLRMGQERALLSGHLLSDQGQGCPQHQAAAAQPSAWGCPQGHDSLVSQDLVRIILEQCHMINFLNINYSLRTTHSIQGSFFLPANHSLCTEFPCMFAWWKFLSKSNKLGNFFSAEVCLWTLVHGYS